MQEQQWDTANDLSDDIDAEYGVKSGYAGRSGGWLEVDYQNNLSDDEQEIADNVENFYKDAKELDALEVEIHEEIKKRHASYSKYIGSAEYYKDIAENLLDDEAIADIYKGNIKDLADKLK